MEEAMYSEYIQLPKHMEMKYCSYVLQGFIKDVKIRNNRIDLDYLRRYYRDNNANFIILRDELLLRGCRFVINKENNLIYNYKLEIKDNDKLIYVKNNRMKYQKLNTILFNYLDFSQIKNDKYFNYLPVRYVAYVNKIENVELVENEFARLGFEFKYMEELEEVSTIDKDINLEENDLETYIFNKGLEEYSFIDRNLERIKSKTEKNQLDLDVFLEKKLSELDFKGDFEAVDLLSRFSINTIEEYLDESYKSLREILNIIGDNKAYSYIKSLNDYILEELLSYSSLDDLMKNINQLMPLFNNSSFYNKDFSISHMETSISLVGLGPLLQEEGDNLIFRRDVFQDIISDYKKIDIEYLEERNIRNIFSYILRASEDEIKDKKKLDDFIFNRIDGYSYELDRKIVGLDCSMDEIDDFDITELEETSIDESLTKNFLSNKSNALYRRIMKSMNLLELIEFNSSMADKKIKKILKKGPSLYDYYMKSWDLKIKGLKGVGIKGRSTFKLELYKIYSTCLKEIEKLNEKILFNHKLNNRDEIKNYSDYFLYQINNKNYLNIDFLDINKDLLYLMDPDINVKAPDLLKNIFKLKNINLKEGKLEGKNLKDALEGLYDYRKFEDNRLKYSSLQDLLDEREVMVLEGRILENKTLEICGKDLGVTRERVRQIEKKAIRKMAEDKGLISFISSLKLFGEKFSEEELRLILNNGLLFRILKDNRIEEFYYSKITNSFYLSDLEQMKNTLISIEKIRLELEDYGYYEDLQEEILRIYTEINSWELSHIIKYFRITIIDEFYYTGNLTNLECLDMYFKYINPSRVKIDEESLEDFQIELTGYFGDQFFLSSVRNISSTIDRVENIIMVDRRTYQYIDYCSFSSEQLDLAKKVLEKVMEEKKRLNSENLYKLFVSVGIDNLISNYHAYFLIKYYFFEDYVFSDKNSMTLYKNEQVKLSNLDIIKRHLEGYDYPIKVKKLVKEVNITKQRVNMTLANNRDSSLIKMYSKVGLAEKIFEGIDYEYLKETLDKSFENGYTTINLIYNRFLFDPRLAGLLEKNKIENSKELSGIVKYVKPEVKGNNMFLYLEESPIKSMYDFINYEYKREVTRKEIIDSLVNDLYLDPQSASLTIERLVEDYNYIQIGSEEFIKEEYLNINRDLEDLVLTLAKVYEEEGFIVPNRLIEENKIDFLSISARENQHIVSYILENNGYKKLSRYSMSYLQEIIVLVKEDSKFIEIQDLVYDRLKNDYRGKLLEEDIYDYLVELGIYEYKEYDGDKKLFQDVLKDNKIIVDWAGRVEL